MSSFINPLGLIVTSVEAFSESEYRPAAWDAPAQTILTVPATSQPGSSPLTDGTTTADIGNLPGVSPFVEKPPQIYIFDAVLRVDHHQRLRITDHPVQTGANITDHAFRDQPTIVLD